MLVTLTETPTPELERHLAQLRAVRTETDPTTHQRRDQHLRLQIRAIEGVLAERKGTSQ